MRVASRIRRTRRPRKNKHRHGDTNAQCSHLERIVVHDGAGQVDIVQPHRGRYLELESLIVDGIQVVLLDGGLLSSEFLVERTEVVLLELQLDVRVRLADEVGVFQLGDFDKFDGENCHCSYYWRWCGEDGFVMKKKVL